MIADVLLDIFDHVDLRTLCASSHVSRLWRASARVHPTFWKTLILDTLCMSADDVVLFLNRLGAKKAPHATIRLAITCPARTSRMNRLVFEFMILPVVREQIHRAEEVDFSVSPEFAPIIWPLFSIDAPHLRGLQVSVDGYGGDLATLPSLFNSHTHQCLEHVVLRDVPLSDVAHPLEHTLASLRATYTIYSGVHASALDRVLSWFPSFQTLDMLPIDRRYRGKVTRLPDLSILQFHALRHLVIHHERHLLGIPHRLVPILTIRIPLKGPGRIRQFIPEFGALALIFRVRMRYDLCYAMTGRVVVATVGGERIREFARVKVSHMESLSFLEDIIRSDRLISLTMPLAVGFRTLCENAYFLPQLTTLRLLLNTLPDPVAGWSPRSVLCPILHHLIFQREEEETEARLSLRALETFLGVAISVDAPEALRIVLEGITLEGDEGDIAVESRVPSAQWHAVSPQREVEHAWLCQNPPHFGFSTTTHRMAGVGQS